MGDRFFSEGDWGFSGLEADGNTQAITSLGIDLADNY
jgi:hypothetical protein